MQTDTNLFTPAQTALLRELSQSRTHILSQVHAGKIAEATLHHLADEVVDLTKSLLPMPVEPAEHLLAAHSHVRPYLERLPLHDPARVVVADETHCYTPRKILRRVLDHALDHLNQIEQWLAWQQDGMVPTPTDGWATSGDTFAEDLQLLSQDELQAWLWRIDITCNLVAQRTRQLSAEQLDWTPPNDGWTLRMMLHHLAKAEIYYSIQLDEVLPEEPLAHYQEASRRFEQQLRQVFSAPTEEATTFFWGEDYAMLTPEQLAHILLAKEQELLG